MKRFMTMALACSMVLALAGMAEAQMEKPETVTISGKLIDMSCAAKGQKLMGNDHNAENDAHMTPKGKVESCATMCLRGGQPAGVYSDGQIKATLLADASQNLYKFAAKDVEVQGWYAGADDDDVTTFFPTKIRLQGTEEWTEVITAQMH